MTCTVCEKPLSGGLDTYGRHDTPVCWNCFNRPCPICKTEGEYEADGYSRDCLPCGGKGYMKPDLAPCKRCKGTGETRNGRTNCVNCNGYGYVVVHSGNLTVPIEI